MFKIFSQKKINFVDFKTKPHLKNARASQPSEARKRVGGQRSGAGDGNRTHI